MIQLVIVSDIKLYREGLEEILDKKDSVCVVGTASNVEQTIVIVKKNVPDVVLIDMTMIACREVVGRIASSCPGTKIIALALTEDEDTILACAKAGIAGYVSREASIDQLVHTVCGVIEGELHCPRRIAASLFHKLESIQSISEGLDNVTTLQSDDSKFALLTQREKQIAKHLTNGLSNKQIARNLSIEISTVKNHVHNILVKMGVGSRMQAASLLLHTQTM